MDILALKRDMVSIEDGRWVAADELPGLGDMRVKVRGANTSAGRELFAAKQRKVDPRDKRPDGSLKSDTMMRLLREMLVEHHLLDIEGLTSGGKPVSADDVRKHITAPDFEPLADLIMGAVAVVDGTRADREKELAGN